MFTALTGACRRAPVSVTVAPGAPAPPIVQNIVLEGFEVAPVRAFEAFRDALPLERGDRLTDKAEQAAGNAAVAFLQNHGYPYAQVRIIRRSVAPDTVDLTVAAEPGTRGVFGAVELFGNRSIDDRIIRRRLAYKPGDLFRRSAIEMTQQRIGATGLFKSVDIRADDVDARPAIVPTVITVEERSPWRWGLSLGYAAGERLGVGASVSHLNFLGDARRLHLEGRLSPIERTVETSFTQTESWHPSLALVVEGRHREIDERSFFVLSRGGQVAVTWRWTPAVSSTFAYAASFEHSDLGSDLALLTGLQDGMLSAWSANLEHRGPALDAGTPVTEAPSPSARGHLASLHLEQAGRWMPGTFSYFSAIGEARGYQPVGRVLVAGRVRYGSIDPAASDADLPFLKRFFMGGASEMRGWGIYELSPLSPAGEPIGGKALFSSTFEARVPVISRITAAAFVEAGNVWAQPWTLRMQSLLSDAGVGTRVDTPFGLIRVDIAWQLRTLAGLRIEGQPQDHRWRINVGLGEAF